MKYTNNSESNKIKLNSTMDKVNKRINKSHRRKQRRKEQLIRLIVFSVIFVLLIVGGLTYFVLKPSASSNITKEFVRDDTTFSISKTASLDIADSFAKDLCVAPENVSYSGIQITDVSASALFDLSNKEVMYADRIYNKVYPASITKVMTALLALEYGNLDDIVTISENAVDLEADSSVCNLMAGDKITLKQLLYGLLVHSGNDAATAIAEYIGGSVDNFLVMMNEKARELGATGTHYVNAHGLHDEEHYTTVFDIYLVFNEALKYDAFIEIINTTSYDVYYVNAAGETITRNWQTTNQYFTQEAATPAGVTIVGGKTGTTDAAGNCLVLLSKDTYGNSYISVVMNSDSKTTLYEQTSQFLTQINK